MTSLNHRLTYFDTYFECNYVFALDWVLSAGSMVTRLATLEVVSKLNWLIFINDAKLVVKLRERERVIWLRLEKCVVCLTYEP